MARGVTWLRWAAIALGCVTALLLAAVLTLFLLIRTDSGRDWLRDTIQQAASAPGELELSIGSLEGDLPERLLLTNITVSDGAGPWLTIDRLSVDWAPLALLWGELEIAEISAGRLSVARTPEAGPDETTREAGGLPVLPVDLSLGRLQIDSLELGEPVLGQAMELEVSAALAVPAGRQIDSRIEITRKGDTPTVMTADARFDPASEELTLTVKADEPAGGLISRLLQLPGLPATELSVTGDGRIDAWNGKLAFDAGTGVALTADIGLSRDETNRLTLNGNANVAAFVPDRLAPLGKEPLAFDIVVSSDDLTSLTVEELRLSSAELSATAKGSIDLGDLIGNLQLDASLTDPARLEPLLGDVGLEGAELRARLQGPLLTPQDLQVDVTARGIATPDIQVARAQASLQVNLSSDQQLAITGDGEVNGLRVEGLDPGVTEAAPLKWQVDATADSSYAKIALSQLTVSRPGLSLDLSGSMDLDKNATDLTARVAVQDAELLQELTTAPVRAVADINATITSDNFEQGAVITLEGQVSQLDSGIAEADALLGSTIEMSGEAEFGAADGIDLRRLSLAARHAKLQLWGTTTTSLDDLDMSYQLTVDELAALSASLGSELAGSATLEGHVSGSLDDLVTNGRFSAPSLRVEGQDIDAVRVDYDVSALENSPQGEIKFSARLDGMNLTGQSGFALAEPERLSLADIDLRVASAIEVTGDLDLDLASTWPDGNLQARLQSDEWLDFAGVAAKGDMSTTLRFDAPQGESQLQADLDGQSLALRLDGETLTLGPTTADVTLDNPLSDPKLQGSITVNSLSAGELSLDRLSLRAKATPQAGDLDLELASSLGGTSDLKTSVAFARNGSGTQIDVKELSGTLIDLPVKLTAPATLRIGEEQQELTDVALTIGDGRIAGGGRVTSSAVQAKFSIDSLPLSYLPDPAGVPDLLGQLDASLELSGNPAQPDATLDVQVPALATEESRQLGLPDIKLDVNGRLQGGSLTVDARAGGFASNDLVASAALPLRLNLVSFDVGVPQNAAIDARLQWQGEAAELVAFAPLDGQTVAGAIQLDFRAGGTLAQPRYSGSLTLREGRYEYVDSGTILEEVVLTVEAEDERLVITELSAKDGARGRLNASGSVQLKPEESFPMELRLDMKRFQVTRMDLARINSDAALDLKGSLSDALLSGTISVRQVDASIPNDLPQQVVTIDVVEVRNGEPVTDPNANKDSFDLNWLRLNVSLDMPRRVFLRGRGLDSEWGGSFTVTGTAETPKLDGSLRPIRGTFTLIGKTFVLQEGSVTFTDSASLEPRLDLSADYSDDGFTAKIGVTGTPTDPDITLSSTPPLPQEEILSRILFNSNQAQLSPLQALELADAAATLSGAGGGGGVFDLVRRTLGIDVLQVRTGDAGAVGVTAGTYVADGVFVGVDQDTATESTKLNVEVELTPNIKLDSTVGSPEDSSVGVRWQWDY